MQPLVNLASLIGYGIAVFLPMFCYLTAIGLFLFAGWGFWVQAQPNNPFRDRPWVPAVSLLLCGVLATFDQLLTKANVSAGTNLQVSISEQLGYMPPTAANMLGNGPADTVVNIVQLFLGFFQPLGALFCFFAVLAFRSIVNGRSRRSFSLCLVQFVAGILLINILTVTQGLVALFQNGTQTPT